MGGPAFGTLERAFSSGDGLTGGLASRPGAVCTNSPGWRPRRPSRPAPCTNEAARAQGCTLQLGPRVAPIPRADSWLRRYAGRGGAELPCASPPARRMLMLAREPGALRRRRAGDARAAGRPSSSQFFHEGPGRGSRQGACQVGAAGEGQGAQLGEGAGLGPGGRDGGARQQGVVHQHDGLGLHRGGGGGKWCMWGHELKRDGRRLCLRV